MKKAEEVEGEGKEVEKEKEKEGKEVKEEEEDFLSQPGPQALLLMCC